MPHPLVVHCRRAPYDVYVGRPGFWGNPFIEDVDGTREEVVQKFRRWLLRNDQHMRQLHRLTGKVLGCWCAPKLCHADVLAELANDPQVIRGQA